MSVPPLLIWEHDLHHARNLESVRTVELLTPNDIPSFHGLNHDVSYESVELAILVDHVFDALGPLEYLTGYFLRVLDSTVVQQHMRFELRLCCTWCTRQLTCLVDRFDTCQRSLDDLRDIAEGDLGELQLSLVVLEQLVQVVREVVQAP